MQAVITNTTYKVAESGNSSILEDLTDKLFLPAEREIFAVRRYSRENEWNALTRFALYALPENDNNTFRIKYHPSSHTAKYWWERSPYAGSDNLVCIVGGDGNAGSRSASLDYRPAPVFA